MSTLVDTNVLLRRLEFTHDHHRAAIAATMRLIESGESLHVATQSIAEFWAVATRPPRPICASNGAIHSQMLEVLK